MKAYGFSLVELMITIAVISILAVIAYPSYLGQVTKTRRTEAMSLLLQDASFMERFYTLNGNYRNITISNNACSSATNATLPYAQSPASGSSIYYQIALDAASCSNLSTYTLTATPQGTQTSDGTLTLDNTGKQGWTNNPSKNTNSWQ